MLTFDAFGETLSIVIGMMPAGAFDKLEWVNLTYDIQFDSKGRPQICSYQKALAQRAIVVSYGAYLRACRNADEQTVQKLLQESIRKALVTHWRSVMEDGLTDKGSEQPEKMIHWLETEGCPNPE